MIYIKLFVSKFLDVGFSFGLLALIYLLGFGYKGSLWWIFLGICVLAFVLTMYEALGYNARCVHGIPNGIAKGKCPVCIDEMNKKQIRDEEIRKIQESISIAVRHRKKEIDRLKNAQSKDLDFLYSLNPLDFETVVMDMYRNLGYTVTQTPFSNDHGKDGIAYKDGKKYLIECKRYEKSQKIGRPHLQKFFAAIVEENAIKGYFVTTSSFANTAEEYSKKSKIDLIDGDELVKLMNKAYPQENDKLNFTAICHQCREAVSFNIYDSRLTTNCKNGHTVHKDITLEDLKLFNNKSVQVRKKVINRRHASSKSYYTEKNIPNYYNQKKQHHTSQLIITI